MNIDVRGSSNGEAKIPWYRWQPACEGGKIVNSSAKRLVRRKGGGGGSVQAAEISILLRVFRRHGSSSNDKQIKAGSYQQDIECEWAGSDDGSSGRSVTSGATLVGSMCSQHAPALAGAATPRDSTDSHQHCPPRRLASLGGAARRFVLRPHAAFPHIVEVVDSNRWAVSYRKITRHGRAWCETFHGVAGEPARPAYASSFASPRAPSLVQTRAAAWTQSGDWAAGQRHPAALDSNRLWEMSSPCPASFPLHCRDARGGIDPVPLAALVADRRGFCYRFRLAGHRMRWEARAATGDSVELRCFVGAAMVATVECGGAGVLSGRRARELRLAPSKGGGRAERLPSLTILPLAFAKLAAMDAEVVESFVLFTGIEVLECLFYTG
ncbi:hypothetical protein H4R26_004703 [Coemansia thaxteri]|uniref:Uncharacterized protein n=1 Tax=Coemansia thaxteri TaxID=2663907 RepID=A0A9W8BA59_9FUNG|nr:hypothetical protein H4R26_004703 [Coemansia thaxteri]KAJ2476466.1 hypothetical protein EV174_004921 [Coemansia sp. RSA 2320]